MNFVVSSNELGRQAVETENVQLEFQKSGYHRIKIYIWRLDHFLFQINDDIKIGVNLSSTFYKPPKCLYFSTKFEEKVTLERVRNGNLEGKFEKV